MIITLKHASSATAWQFYYISLIYLILTLTETHVQFLVWEDPLEEGMATHSSILTWRIQWSEEPSGLQSIELQRVRHDLLTKPPPPHNWYLFYFHQVSAIFLPLSTFSWWFNFFLHWKHRSSQKSPPTHSYHKSCKPPCTTSTALLSHY